MIGMKKGSVVSFEYDNYSRSELPVNARIRRIRDDIKWEEVVHDSTREEPGLNTFSLYKHVVNLVISDDKC